MEEAELQERLELEQLQGRKGNKKGKQAWKKFRLESYGKETSNLLSFLQEDYRLCSVLQDPRFVAYYS